MQKAECKLYLTKNKIDEQCNIFQNRQDIHFVHLNISLSESK
jgi:hypothetical protein